MNLSAALKNDKRKINRSLMCLNGYAEEIHHVEYPDARTVKMEGNVFDVITCVYLLRQQYIKHGVAWDVMELTLHPDKPYWASLRFSMARESFNNQLQFKIKCIDYEKN